MATPRIAPLLVVVALGALVFGIVPGDAQGLLRLDSLTTNLSQPQAVGTPITVTATASGGIAPYQFKWWAYNGTSWTPLTGWGLSATYVWTPTVASSQSRIGVWIRNAGSTIDAYDNSASNGSILFATTSGAAPLTLTALTTNLSQPQAVGTPITVTATATGGTAPYQYKWWGFNGTSWTALTGWGLSATYLWTPTVASPHSRIGVWIRNAGSTADAYDNAASNGSILFATTSGAAPLTLTALTTNLSQPQAVGTPIMVTATATGGTAPYEYKWWGFNGTSWTALTGWGLSATYLWTPTVASPYSRIGVWIRNAGSTADAYDNARSNGSILFATTSGTGPLTLDSLTTNLPQPQRPGTPITVTATATGGTAPYQYKWWVFNGTSWTALTGWGPSATYLWTPTVASPASKIGVWIRNAGSTTDAYDNSRSNGSIPFSVTPLAAGDCVAFSPYIAGDAEFGPHPSPDVIDSLLDTLIARTGATCIMTYGHSNGLTHIFDAASARGLTVTSIIWLDENRAINEASITLGIQSARDHPATITHLSCGSEVRTRLTNRYPQNGRAIAEAEIGNCLTRVRAATVPQRLMVIDTWWMMCNESPQCQRWPLLDSLLDIGINVHPWWENVYSGIYPCIVASEAAAFILDRVQALQAAYPEKQVTLTEFGWPSGPSGTRNTPNRYNQQQCAIASTANQVLVVQDTLTRLRDAGFTGYTFAAFSEPWKVRLEGPIGAYWGILLAP